MSQAPSSAVEFVRSCPACGGSVFTALPLPQHQIGEEFFRMRKAACGLNRCRACGLEFVNPRPVAGVLADFYNQPGYAAHPEADDEYRKAVVRERAVRVSKPSEGARLLDIGCGNGLFLEECRQRGWECVGMEPSVHGRAITAGRGFSVHAALQDVARLESPFDLITLYHVLEHVADLDELFQAVRPVLKPGGRLVVEVPNLGSFRARFFSFLPEALRRDDDRYRAFPIHLYGFSARSLGALLQRGQFRTVRITTAGLGLGQYRSRAVVGAVRAEASAATTSTPSGKLNWRGPARFVWRAMEQGGWGENLTITAEPIPQ